MINTKELERRWYKYKAKIFTRFFFVLMMVILLPYLLYYIYSNRDILLKSIPSIRSAFSVPNEQSNSSKVVPMMNKEKSAPDINHSDVKEDLSAPLPKPAPKTEVETLELSPTIPLLDIEEERPERPVKKRTTHHVKSKPKAEKQLIPAKKSGTLSAQELALVQGKDLPHERKKINFIRSSANYKEVMQRKFESNRNPREALLLAKAYYQEADYTQAEEWALKANQLDGSLEESWLLFAKSKAKLGKRKEALKILSSYYKRSRSTRVRTLMDKIKQGSV